MQKRIQKIKEAKADDDYMGGNLEDLDVSGTSSVIYEKQAAGKFNFKNKNTKEAPPTPLKPKKSGMG